MKSKLFRLLRRSLLLILPLLLFALAGCSTTDSNAVMAAPGSDYSGPDSVARLHIGDAVGIADVQPGDRVRTTIIRSGRSHDGVTISGGATRKGKQEQR